MGKKFSLAVLLLLFFVNPDMHAQMSDEKVLEHIMEQQKNGVPQDQIILDLTRRGVTPAQLQLIKSKYGSNSQATQNASAAVSSQRGRIEPQLPELAISEPGNEKRIFGHNIFHNRELTFEPNLNLPTPQNYTLGPGDEVIIDIWGASQTTLHEVISPDGNILVSDLGPLYLNGMTVAEANTFIKRKLGQIYSGLESDEATSYIKLTLGQNRSIQINVMGEVVNPGTYTVSSFATLFHALYLAGGPNETGSLRDIQVYRNGKKVVSADVYDYLIHGNMAADARLFDADVVVVPPYRKMVAIDGKVRRPMLYEMSADETLSNLMDYAGGLSADAYKKDVRLIRMGDLQREIQTVGLEEQPMFALCDGDSVYVDSILTTEFSNMVEIKGAVFRPGMFQIGEGIGSVKELVAAAGGLKEDALSTRAILTRTNPDKTLTNFSINIKDVVEGTAHDVQLLNRDLLLVSSLADVRDEEKFSINGEVLVPGVYKYASNTSIQDLILMAGGLKNAASVSKVDVVRPMRDRFATEKSDVLAETFSFSIDENLKIEQGEFTLQPFDEVYVRRSPGYSEQHRVKVEGEVLFAGFYSLTTSYSRLSDLLSQIRFTDEAYLDGARLERVMSEEEVQHFKILQDQLEKKDTLINTDFALNTTYSVGINLKEALRNPGSYENVYLRDGDRLCIPRFQNTIRVNGEVMYSNTTTFIKGKRVGYYIDKAGGYSQRAKKNKLYVVQVNGTVDRVRRGSSKHIQPGAEIIVPAKVKRDGMTTSEILSLSSTSASLATVVLALINLFR